MREVVLLALLILVAMDWVAVALLTWVIRKARSEGSRIPAANDRRRAAFAIAIGSTLIMFLSLNAELGQIVKGDILIVLLVVAILVPSLANLLFLLDVLRGVYR
jgi:hypothetical protein